jgi:beta-lactamase superfamily II metal-dependent hydrolase
MALPEFFILDVGHGNCAVLHDTAGTTVIDCAPGATLREALRQIGVNRISLVLISHADEDHVGGLIGLLTDPELTIEHVYLNPDAIKQTKIWGDVKSALADARRRNETHIHAHLTSDLTGSLDKGEVHVEVLAPTPELALCGAGGRDLEGHKLTSNSMSAVIRLVYKERKVVLLTGDVDAIGLRNLLATADEVEAEILVYPHHGGKAGGEDPRAFAEALFAHIHPSRIIFSIARSRVGFPRPEVIENVRAYAPGAHIACTQLAQECAAEAPTEFPHLANYPARGRDKNSCCAGTIRIEFGTHEHEASIAQHQAFVKSLAPTMCTR